jgi:thiamine pyrophosphokinase
MRVFLFLRGGYSKKQFYLRHFSETMSEEDVVMCANGGYALARSLGIRPHYIIGDLDSVAREELEGAAPASGRGTKQKGSPEAGDGRKTGSKRGSGPHAHQRPTIIRFPRDKDFSDFELSLKKAFELGPERVFVYSALGGRKDHELINVLVLAHAPKPVVFCEQDVEIYNVTGSLHLRGRAGEMCSLFTCSDSCEIDEMRGFQYLLSHEVLLPSSRGLSNRIVDEYAYIKKSSGTLVVVVNLCRKRR